MSDPSEKQPAPFPLPGILSILVALLAIFAEQFEPLQSSRPPVPQELKPLSTQPESIDARLWQDPMAVITDYLNNTPADKLRGGILAENLVDHRPESGTKPVIVLGVMVFGGAYAELREFRLRTRYAVLSGLAATHYVPEDPDHISFFNFKIPPNENLSHPIPFEWFVKEQGGRDESPILLLWLNESNFMDKPIRSLQNLTAKITESVKADQAHSAESTWPDPPFKFKFIGPTSSTLLIRMAQERIDNTFRESDIKEPLELYIASATADERIILQNAVSPTGSEENTKALKSRCHARLTECFKSRNSDKVLINLTRVIAEDGELIESILDELKLRGVDPIDEHAEHPIREHFTSKSHIALISEWDTFYGRALPETMINRINDRTQHKAASGSSTCVSQADTPGQPSWLHLYSYMRGLDGMVPGMTPSKENNLKTHQQNGDDKKNAPPEKPEGESQQDYLRRLAERIEDANDCLNRHNEGEIRAFGLLGNDVYDKLMILKALKPKFPRALFFTTDLNATLIYPEEYEATRNLIVASSFGFQLHPNLQGKIPPFRDNYGTAHFLATQIALHDAVHPEKLKQQAIEKMRKPPRIFELGFQRVFDFAPPDTQPCPSLGQCKNLHPAGYTAWPGWKMAIALFLAFCLVSLIVVLLCTGRTTWLNCWLPRCKSPANEQKTSSAQHRCFAHPVLALTLCILAAGLIVSAMEMHPGYQGEPFAWVAGVSLWPSILIRLLACLLCWLFVFKVLHDLPDIQTKLAEDFSLQEQKHLVMDLGFLERLQRPWRIKLDHDADSMEKLWHSYRLATQPQFLRSRAIQSLLIYLAFGVCLVSAFGMPLIPYRGSVSLAAHWLVLVPTIIGFVFLIMLIVDTTRHCIRLIHVIDDQRLAWPGKTLDYFGFEGANPFAEGAPPITSEAGKLRQEFAKTYQLEHWLGIQFITALTKKIGTLIYYPFIILALLVFALTPIFDNWHIPTGLALVFIFSALLTLICSLFLRKAAEHTRNSALKSLTIALMAVRGREEKSARTIENQLTMAIDQIKSIREGAFLPLTHEPAIQALLLPLGGWGGFTLLEHIILSGA